MPGEERGGPAVSRLALIFSIGALSLAVVTALFVLLFVIQHDRELAARDSACAQKLGRLTAKVEALEKDDPQVELRAIKNWLIAVYGRADARGWRLPDLPKGVTP